MSDMEAASLNSRQWWENYFQADWDANDGRGQTAFFMQRLVENLPPADKAYLRHTGPSVLDWGCALGNGVDVLARSFPGCRVTGLDFAAAAVAEARRCFPDYEFRHTPDGDFDNPYDVIVVSNCLEHFSDPLELVRRHLLHCRRMYLVLVPYCEAPLHKQHISRFEEASFPERLGQFTRLATVVIDCHSPYWPGKQLLVVYGSRGYLALRTFWLFWLRIVSACNWCTSQVRRWRRKLFVGLPRSLSVAATAVWRGMKRWGGKCLPPDTLRGRLTRAGADHLRQVRHLGRRGAQLSLTEVLDQSAERRGIVIYPPFIDWGWMRQRPQQLMAAFAAKGYLSLYCSPRRRTDSFRGFQRVGERLYLCDRPSRLYELPSPVLLSGWPFHCDLLKRFHSPLLVYDYLDDLGVAAEDGAIDGRKLAAHRRMVLSAAVVLATSRRLHDEVRQLRPDVIYCPNGADYEHFHPAVPPLPPSELAEAVAAGRPIIGYYGALARWFDYDLLSQAASLRKDCCFVLIGPDLDGSLAASGVCRRHPNVHWLGEKSYADLPAYLHHFSVATIPFQVNRITEAVSPVKLFEYMAGGKPIVTTDLPECREYPCIMVCRDATEFVVTLDEAIQRGKQESYRRLLDRQARANTWDARVETIIKRLEELGKSRKLRSA